MGEFANRLQRRLRKPTPHDVLAVEQRVERAEMKAALKGQFDGRCNRSACMDPIVGANWWNTSTRAYYCKGCAQDINAFSFRAEGIRICVEVTSPFDQPPFPVVLAGEPA